MSRPTPAGNTAAWSTLGEIQRANADAGGYWFSPGAVRFFDSTAFDHIYGGNWFVYRNRFTTSDGVTETYWKVAHAGPDGQVYSDAVDWSITVGPVGSSYATKAAAVNHALALEAGRIGCECVGCDGARRRHSGTVTRHVDLAGDLGAEEL